MTRVLEMSFINSAEDTVIINVSDPRDDLTRAEVDMVMESIVAKNIFATKGGDLVQVKDAVIRVYDVVQLA